MKGTWLPLGWKLPHTEDENNSAMVSKQHPDADPIIDEHSKHATKKEGATFGRARDPDSIQKGGWLPDHKNQADAKHGSPMTNKRTPDPDPIIDAVQIEQKHQEDLRHSKSEGGHGQSSAAFGSPRDPNIIQKGTAQPVSIDDPQSKYNSALISKRQPNPDPIIDASHHQSKKGGTFGKPRDPNVILKGAGLPDLNGQTDTKHGSPMTSKRNPDPDPILDADQVKHQKREERGSKYQSHNSQGGSAAFGSPRDPNIIQKGTAQPVSIDDPQSKYNSALISKRQPDPDPIIDASQSSRPSKQGGTFGHPRDPKSIQKGSKIRDSSAEADHKHGSPMYAKANPDPDALANQQPSRASRRTTGTSQQQPHSTFGAKRTSDLVQKGGVRGSVPKSKASTARKSDFTASKQAASTSQPSSVPMPGSSAAGVSRQKQSLMSGSQQGSRVSGTSPRPQTSSGATPRPMTASGTSRRPQTASGASPRPSQPGGSRASRPSSKSPFPKGTSSGVPGASTQPSTFASTTRKESGTESSEYYYDEQGNKKRKEKK